MNVKESAQELIEYVRSKGTIFKVVHDNEEKFEVKGTLPAMQGRKKVDGFYFLTVVPKPKDVRLYFFPIYTHKDKVGEISEHLKKALKGKSCFHIKKWDVDMKKDVYAMIDKGIHIYQREGLLDTL